MSNTIVGPFKLGDIEPVITAEQSNAGDAIELHAANHGAIATIVWRMAHEKRSPECEAFAHQVVRCLNAHNDLVLVLASRLVDLYNPFDRGNQSNTYLKYAALYEAATGEKVPKGGW